MPSPDPDPLVALTVELAKLIDPAACADLLPDATLKQVTEPRATYALTAATSIMVRVCLVVEQEYAAYFSPAGPPKA